MIHLSNNIHTEEKVFTAANFQALRVVCFQTEQKNL